MTREEFIKQCAILGIGGALLPAFLQSCGEDDSPIDVNFSGKVLVIGAGAAGLMAGYTLKRYGIDFQVLEAAPTFGGRVKKITGFADFPIDLGAEWIHENPDILVRLLNDSNAKGSVDTIPYNPKDVYNFSDGGLVKQNWANHFYAEYKFKNTTWHDFFEDFVVPGIADHLVFDSPVASIDYSGDMVKVKDASGNEYEADKVILTVPIAVLREGDIDFEPPLSSDKNKAFINADMGDGMKAFFEFSEKFYPDILLLGGLIEGFGKERIYYNAAYKKDTNQHILGLFTAGNDSTPYTSLGSDKAIYHAIMKELDEMFEGKATQYYKKHVIQNWSADPYIKGSYSHYGDDYEEVIATLSEPLDNKVFFAGEAYTDGDWSTVHGAGLSGISVAETILKG